MKLVVLVLALTGIFTGVVNILQTRDIHRLQRDIACLKHPTRAISAVTYVHGHATTPSLVVCP